jgi:hypothetical protein
MTLPHSGLLRATLNQKLGHATLDDVKLYTAAEDGAGVATFDNLNGMSMALLGL